MGSEILHSTPFVRTHRLQDVNKLISCNVFQRGKLWPCWGRHLEAKQARSLRIAELYVTHTKKMPKKFKGVNSKAEEARVRRESVKVAEREKKQKEEEDSYWQDNDKHVQRKQQRKVSCSTAVLLVDILRCFVFTKIAIVILMCQP